jgi:hypothetical protein
MGIVRKIASGIVNVKFMTPPPEGADVSFVEYKL